MDKIVCNDYREMSKIAADIVSKQVNLNTSSVLGLPTGSTPIGMYKELIEMYKAGKVDFSQVKTFNLDEYHKIDRSNDQSYYYFMFTNFFNHINIKKENVNIPNGSVDDVESECKRYDDLIANSGGIDLQVLGIGTNGHIGFNEPAQELMANTHYTSLTHDTIDANSRFFDNIEDVPRHALTLGMGGILKAKKIILLISGENKAKLVKELFNNKITTNMPASLLMTHRDTTLIVDKAAYGN